MRNERKFLIIGLIISVIVGVYSFQKYGITQSILGFLISVILARVLIYLYFERHLPKKKFEDFVEGKIFHECTRCGDCCHLKINLSKQDYNRILKYAQKKRINKEIIQKRGDNYWLVSEDGCIFLNTKTDGSTYCSIYEIRPVSCRLYPLTPTGKGLKLDPNCKGLNESKGQKFKEYLKSQDVLTYVRQHWEDAKKFL